LSPPLQQVLRGALEKDPDRRIQDVLELQRRFCEAVEAPVAVSESRANRHAAEAFAETLPGPSVAARPAPQPVPLNQPAAVGDRPTYWKSLQQFWQQLPEPLRWVVMGAVLLSVVRSEVLVGSEEVVAGGALGYAAWYLFVANKAKKKRQAAAEAASTVPPAPTAMPAPATTKPVVASQPVAGGRTPVAGVARAPRAQQVYPPKAPPRLLLRDRLRDMNLSAAAALPFVLVVTASLFFLTDVIPGASEAVFFGMTTLICVWALLIPAKLWEGVAGEGLLRRSLQFSNGVLVGLLVWWLQDFLLLGDAEFFHTEGSGVIADRLRPNILLLSDEVPTATGFMIFFGLLFGARRWWHQADRWRSARMRISSAMVSLLAGAAVSWLLPFPVALGSTLALSISMVLQLSAGWLPPRLRVVHRSENPVGVI
jgi:hypothetical protein